MKYRIIHHSDADGHASAMVVWTFLTTKKRITPQDISFCSINYGIELPKVTQSWDWEKDEVYLVDFSFQPIDKMIAFVNKVKNLIWIDHHKTSLDYQDQQMELIGVGGVRDSSAAACQLCWDFFFGRDSTPKVIELIGAWDTWDRSDMNRFEEAQSLNMYLMSFDSRPFKSTYRWKELLDEEDLSTILNLGSDLKHFKRQIEDVAMRSCAFKGKFAGYSAIMVNLAGSSMQFERFPGGHDVDLWVTFQMKRGGYWMVSLYTEKPEKLDCASLAKKLGEAGPIPSGGGHPKAAGFETDFAYFWSLVERA